VSQVHVFSVKGNGKTGQLIL